ncbi:hypothetical protein M501DRAFT_1004159, partial [Patellaria atrata CBS 101060]
LEQLTIQLLSPQKRTAKVKEPAPYNGKRDELRGFLTQVRIYHKRIGLTDDSEPEIFKSFPKFEETLKNVFREPDEPLIIAFYQGLKEEVKDEWEVVTLAVRIDNRLYERRQEKGGRKNVIVRYRKKVIRATNRQD